MLNIPYSFESIFGDSTQGEFLTPEEIDIIMQATLFGQGGNATEEELQRAINWAIEAAIGEALLKLVLTGLLTLDARQPEIKFQVDKTISIEEALKKLGNEPESNH